MARRRKFLTRRNVERFVPALILIVAGVLTAVTVGTPATNAIANKSGACAELYEITHGQRIVLDHFCVRDDGKPHPRLVSLHYASQYGPSSGTPDPMLFGVTYNRWWQYDITGTAYAHYDQQMTGWWYLGAVQPQYRAQYMTGCTGHGISPPACGLYGFGTAHWNETRDTQNTMWQWNYTGYAGVELNNKLSGPWVEVWVGEIHMMGNGTMWWDAFKQSPTDPIHCDLNCGP